MAKRRTSSCQRVKVYRLSEDGKWDDQGTGHVTVDYLERSEELALYVIDEEDSETLLLHRISPDDIYRKQEETIISWRDPEYSTELALSFQETTGCSYIWDHICNVQRSLQFSTLNSDTFHSMNSELRELPAVELSTLPLILKTVSENVIADHMRMTELLLNDQDFFRKLMDLFRVCDDLENIDGLHMIFKIVRGIILLNSPQIFEKIFSDELIMDIIGALESLKVKYDDDSSSVQSSVAVSTGNLFFIYVFDARSCDFSSHDDPEVSNVQHYRSFLKEHVVFKEAIPIKDPLVLSKIHQTYRIGYLKDVVLARVLDEGTIASLNSIIHTNNSIVVSLLKDDSTFIQELFARLRSPTTSAESKKNLIYFLHEFCSLSKSLQMVQLIRLFRDLVTEGIFDIITDTLQYPDKKLVLTGTDILILFLNQDPNLLRSYVVRPEGISLLGLLVKGMITDFGDDMHCQFLEILRSLLDSFTLTGAQRDTITEIFYEKHLGQLVDVIVASCSANSSGRSSPPGENENENENRVKPEILSNICDLLCFCVLHHPYRIKCNFILNNVIDKVLLLTLRREKYLVVAAVRFARTILSRHDEHLINHFVKNNLLKPIIDAFVSNGNRYNLLNSVVLELFEYVRKENIKAMVKYIVDSFWDDLVKFESLAAIASLKVKYEQCLDNGGNNIAANALEARKRSDDRAPEKEEEDYFNEDSDEEDTASASQSPKVQAQPAVSNGLPASYSALSPKSGGLVDYEDDEDDEDYRPPPKKQPETTEEDEGVLESLRMKRKLPAKGQEHPKKHRLGKNPKARESVFAALCSTLGQAVLPNKKSSNTTHGMHRPSHVEKDSGEESHVRREPEAAVSNHPDEGRRDVDEESHEDTESAAAASTDSSDSLHDPSENGQLRGEDGSMPPPSPEMVVNGS